jgi:glutaminase
MRAVDVYTRQCSTLISAEDLAVMGATLAAGGLNPRTRQRVVSAANVPFILAEMTMEGLYTASGDWAYRVGLPGKSGVGGGILAVAPGMLAIAAFSPPLDAAGNSVRGQAAVASVARDLGLNLYAGSAA